jgi:hypothetical protein
MVKWLNGWMVEGLNCIFKNWGEGWMFRFSIAPTSTPIIYQFNHSTIQQQNNETMEQWSISISILLLNEQFSN